MRIDLSNYEAFFLDYREGNLDEARVEELFAFLEQYPELKEELDNFEEIVLEDEIKFEHKQSLKKTEYNEEALIAYVEGQMEPRERLELEHLASENTSLQKELGLYQRTIVQPDTSITFPAKKKLKRGGVVVYLQANPGYLRVAAAILLLLGLFALISEFYLTSSSNGLPALAHSNKSEARKYIQNSTSLSKPGKEVQPVRHDSIASSENSAKHNVAVRQVKQKEQMQNESAPVPPERGPEKAILAHKDASADSAVNHALVMAGADRGATQKIYINYRSEADEDEQEPVLTAAVSPRKKTFFDKLTNAARKAHAMGVKQVDAEEDEERKSIVIGGFVVSENTH